MPLSEKTYAKRWTALALLAAAQFVVVLDASIVNVALPSIGRDLHIVDKDLSWVINAYILVFGGFLLLGGRLGDLLGRRRMFIVGLLAFGVASLLGGLSTNSGQLITARAVQGLAAALLSPAALAIVINMFKDGHERTKALGVWAAVAGSAGAAGVLLGGVLTEAAGWEWVLFVNVPIVAVVAVLAPRVVPESRNSGPKVFDAAGAVTITASLGMLVYALIDANDAGWGSAQTVGLLAGSAAMLALFVVIELRRNDPLVPFPGIFRIRTVVGANISAILITATMFPLFFFLTLYMQQVLHYKPIEAGVAYLPLSLGIVASAGIASPLVTRIGYKLTLIAGFVFLSIGLLWFSQISPGGSFLSDLLFPSLITAIGLGLTFVPMTVAAVTGVDPHEAGLASGVINTSQQIGGALGLAVLSVLWTNRSDTVAATGASPRTVLTEGLQDAFLGASALALLGAVVAAFLISSKDSRDHAGTAREEEIIDAPIRIPA